MTTDTRETAEKIAQAAYDRDEASESFTQLANAIDKALRDEREARQWQPIETAPKDEAEIILACFITISIVPITFVANSYWLPRCVGSPLLGDPNEQCVCCPGDSSYTGKWKGWEHYCAYPPTHWLPLPEPTTIRRNEGSETSDSK
jgi:hypothetical protein